MRSLARTCVLKSGSANDYGRQRWSERTKEGDRSNESDTSTGPDVQAKSSTGSLHFDAAWGLHPPRPFPVPSYASEKFFALVGGWFDQVCPIIARHQAPDGCIVAVQSDNESCYLFHDQPYATDYSDASLALYRTFLPSEYGNIQRLNTEYGTGHRTFEEVEPPARLCYRQCR